MTREEALGFAYDVLVHEMEMIEETLRCEHEMDEDIDEDEQWWMIAELRAAANLLNKMIMNDEVIN